MTWLIDTLIATGALIALVLVLRRPVARYCGPGIAYALWALPLLRLAMPPLVLPAVVQPAQVVIAIPGDAAASATVAAEPLSLWTWLEPALLALWLIGAGAYLLWRAVTYLRLRRALLADARPVGKVGAVRLVESAAAITPLAFGLRDKVVALPPGFMLQQDRTARDLAIAHELEHHAGRDLAVNIAMQPLLALHWFNPLAWLAWRALRRDQEAACDARVMAGRDHDVRAAYGTLLADYARAPRISLAASIACPVVGEASVVYRLRSLTMTDPTPVRRTLGRLLLAGGALALPLTASISYAAADDPKSDRTADSVGKALGGAMSDPAVQKKNVQVVILDHEAGADPADPKLQTRVIEKDGKTIVIKTAKPLSDAEIEERINKAEASVKGAEAMVVSDKDSAGKIRTFTLVRADGDSAGDAPATERKRVVVMSGDAVQISGDTAASVVQFHNKDGKPGAFAMVSHGDVIACTDGSDTSTVSEDQVADGKRQIVKMQFCSTGNNRAAALEAMKKARDRMKDNTSLSAEVKDKILKNLDEQIEKMSRQG